MCNTVIDCVHVQMMYYWQFFFLGSTNISCSMSDWLLFNAQWAICQLYHSCGEQVNFQWYDEFRFVLDQHALLDFSSDIYMYILLHRYSPRLLAGYSKLSNIIQAPSIFSIFHLVWHIKLFILTFIQQNNIIHE